MKTSISSSTISKFYKDSQAAVSAWAGGSSLVLSKLLGIPLSWEFAVEPVFYYTDSSKFSTIWLPGFYIWLPAEKTLTSVSESLHEIFNLNFNSEIDIRRYYIRSTIQKHKNLTLVLDFHQIHFLVFSVPLDEESSLTINLYPILYDENAGVWLKRFTITYIYNKKNVIFDRKINALSFDSTTKPKNLSNEEKENILKLTKKIIPSFSETIFALLNSKDVKTLDYEKHLYSDMEKLLYAFFIPRESLNRQGLILNWGFSLTLRYKL